MEKISITGLEEVLVDSGQIAFADPTSYDLVKERGELLTFSTEIGDGVYPVLKIKEYFDEEQTKLKSIQIVIDICENTEDGGVVAYGVNGHWMYEEEEDRLLAAVIGNNTNPHLFAQMITAIDTGMRLGEQFKLTWEVQTAKNKIWREG